MNNMLNNYIVHNYDGTQHYETDETSLDCDGFIIISQFDIMAKGKSSFDANIHPLNGSTECVADPLAISDHPLLHKDQISKNSPHKAEHDSPFILPPKVIRSRDTGPPYNDLPSPLYPLTEYGQETLRFRPTHHVKGGNTAVPKELPLVVERAALPPFPHDIETFALSEIPLTIPSPFGNVKRGRLDGRNSSEDIHNIKESSDLVFLTYFFSGLATLAALSLTAIA
jgi:hypothetical protein